MEDFFVNMDYWYQRNPGLLLLEEERAILSALLSQKQGDYLLQCGGPSDLSLVSGSSIPNKVYCGFDVLRSYATRDVVVADVNTLPFLPGSIDVTVILHLLSFIERPQELLQQVYQSLTPDGQLFVLGFNAWSLWGMSKLTHLGRAYPWCGQFYSMSKVASWLQSCGFNVIVKRPLCFRPPVRESKLWDQLLFLEALGHICCPRFGGVYFLMAQKNDTPMTALRSRGWRDRYAASRSYPEATTMDSPSKL